MTWKQELDGIEATRLLDDHSLATHRKRDALTMPDEDDSCDDRELDVDTTAILDEDGRVVKDPSVIHRGYE